MERLAIAAITTTTTASATTTTTTSCSSINRSSIPIPLFSYCKARHLSFPRRPHKFLVFASNDEPKLNDWDKMELKFGQMLGEDPKLTLAKVFPSLSLSLALFSYLFMNCFYWVYDCALPLYYVW